MNKTIIAVLIAVVVVGGGAFYGGLLYGQSQQPAGRGNFGNLTDSQRQQLQQGGQRTGARQVAGANFANGEITAQDEQSLTIKTRDGGSKIVFFSTSTEVSRFATGAASDLVIGQTVMVTGQTNSDGSLTAKTIQTRPQLPNLPSPGSNAPNPTTNP